MLRKFFLDHPASVGETYPEHFGVACSVGFAMIWGGLGALVHALVPAFCKNTGSKTIFRLHAQIVESRSAKRDQQTIEWNI